MPGKPDADQDLRFLAAAGPLLGHDPEDIAMLHVPEHASPTARLVAHAIGRIATGRLQSGDRLDFSLNVAAGRDLIVRELAAHHGVHRDRSTVADALNELVHLGVLTRAGQLQPWVDRAGIKSGAYVYTLRARFRRLGDLATAARVRAQAPLAAVGGEARIERCLKAAIRLADVGQRNALGHWLARRCRDERLTFSEAEKIVTTYQRRVPQRPAYTTREALATLTSVYRRT